MFVLKSNAPKSWFSFSIAVLLLAACSSNNNGSTSSGGGNGTGATGATGSNGSGPTGGSSTGNATGGTTTGGVAAQDPIGTQCSKTGATDYQSCSTSLDCQCPLVCGLDF